MIWAAWRQQRAQLLVMAVTLVVGGAVLAWLWTGSQGVIEQNGLGPCVADAHQAQCRKGVQDFQGRYYDLMKCAQVACLVLPALAGAFMGAPLVARELEQGTYVLAFTQSVGRTRWLLTKVAVSLLPMIVLVAALLVLLRGWIGSAGQLGVDGQGAFQWLNYDTSGFVSVAYAVFAVTLGVLVGLLVRRTVPAMALALGLFLVVRLVLAALRPVLVPFHRVTGGVGQQLAAGERVAGAGFLNSAGQPITVDSLKIRDCTETGTALEACYQKAGVAGQWAEYRVAGDFWPLQGLESALYLCLAAALLAAAVWWLRERVR
ncbi:ABC transporter permease [Kutzneria viridogrisea]|uniref:ABC-2 family transporter n=1 Tax=Kutzneria viridogrisea TaxID=47990 RepID=A0ABR6BNP1_9PSEU|nr:hypothetical protein [Kutzneria viridogrisea]